MLTDKITKRLSLIQENYRLLEEKLNLNMEDFLQNPDNYLTTERLLHLISEAILINKQFRISFLTHLNYVLEGSS